MNFNPHHFCPQLFGLTQLFCVTMSFYRCLNKKIPIDLWCFHCIKMWKGWFNQDLGQICSFMQFIDTSWIYHCLQEKCIPQSYPKCQMVKPPIFGAMKILRVLCYHLRKKRRAIICPKTCEEAVPKIGSLINFLEAHYENG